MIQQNKCIILVGISGSGKSTFTTSFLKENTNYLRINRDSIRLTLVGDLTGYYQRKDLNRIEDVVSYIERDIFSNIIFSGREVILDNCHLKQEYINKWMKLASSMNKEVNFKLFDCPLKVAKQRVYCRDFLNQPEPDYEFNDYSHLKQVEYIEKQFEQYKSIKQYLEKSYGKSIIT